MGHTVWSQRQTLNHLITELERYGRTLRAQDRDRYNTLLALSRKHAGAMTFASSAHTWAFLLLSILLEQEKRLEVLERDAHGHVP